VKTPMGEPMGGGGGKVQDYVRGGKKHSDRPGEKLYTTKGKSSRRGMGSQEPGM